MLCLCAVQGASKKPSKSKKSAGPRLLIGNVAAVEREMQKRDKEREQQRERMFAETQRLIRGTLHFTPLSFYIRLTRSRHLVSLAFRSSSIIILTERKSYANNWA